MNHIVRPGMAARPAMIARINQELAMRALVSFLTTRTYRIECFARDGNLKWVEEIENLTTNVGLNDILTQYWKGSSYTASFFVGLKGAGTIAAADTMASHAGWTDIAGYSNGTRPALTLGTVASQSVDNSASKAVFNINATNTIAGAFVTTNSTVSGTTGTLVGAADFSSSRAVISGDTLNVQITNTAS
jgi:hypothetical protein